MQCTYCDRDSWRRISINMNRDRNLSKRSEHLMASKISFFSFHLKSDKYICLSSRRWNSEETIFALKLSEWRSSLYYDTITCFSCSPQENINCLEARLARSERWKESFKDYLPVLTKCITYKTILARNFETPNHGQTLYGKFIFFSLGFPSFNSQYLFSPTILIYELHGLNRNSNF